MSIWNESEHPRDEKGQFVEKEQAGKLLGVKLLEPSDLRSQLKNTKARNSISNKNLKKIIDMFNGDIPEEILYITYFNERADKNHLLQEAKEAKEKFIKEENEPKDLEPDYKKTEEEAIKNLSKQFNISEETASKIHMVSKKYTREMEKNTFDLKFNISNGYSGNSKSKRALQAELDGKFTLSRAKEIFGLSYDKIKKYFKPTEWHHTSALYNETSFYDLSEVANFFEGNDNNLDLIKELFK